jgi:hypothetical protein
MTRDWSLGFAKKEYEKLFGSPVPGLWISGLGVEIKERELAKLQAVATKRGYRPGWVSWRFKSLFGHWPRRVA